MELEGELGANISIYSQFLEVKDVLKIIDVLKSRYVDQSTAKEVLSIILGFFASCKKMMGEPKMEAHVMVNYLLEMGSKWLKIKQ